MKVTRTFYKTGQALFAVERITCHNQQRTIVYDCGGENVQSIQSAIGKAFNNNNNDVLAVFISHYHNDHINGLKELFNICNVKYLFLPMIESNNTVSIEAFEALCKSANSTNLNSGVSAAELAFDTENAVKKLTEGTNNEGVKIIKIRMQEEQKLEDRDVKNSITLDSEDVANGTYDSSTHFNVPYEAGNGVCWRYIPFNPQSTITIGTDQWEHFVSKINNIFGRDTTVSEVYKYIKDNGITPGKLQEATRAAKIQYSGNSINEYSMTLYSGPYAIDSDDKNGKTEPTCCQSWKMACLFLGDYMAKDNQNMANLKNIYQRVWNNIAVIQIPHHGSRHNFNMDLILDNAFHIIPNGDDCQVDPYRAIYKIEKKGEKVGFTENGDVETNHYCHPRQDSTII